MRAAKRNLSTRRVGKGRGVPIRMAAVIARKYALDQIIVWTHDRQKRQRILFWGSSDPKAIAANTFAQHIAKSLGWPKGSCEIEMAFIRRLKDRIKDLELQFARIIEREDDPFAIARSALRLPEDL